MEKVRITLTRVLLYDPANSTDPDVYDGAPTIEGKALIDFRDLKENDVDLTQISIPECPEDSWCVEIVDESTGQEWTLDEDGTRHPKLVSGVFRSPITHVTDGDKKLADYNE